MNKNSISTARINKKDKIFFIRAFFVLFVAICSPDIYGLQGQELYFSKLSDKVPIPASETYNVIQDKQGYIWFATEEGFCRYSNNNLKVYDAQEGLPEKAVYASAIGPDGKLWIATRNRRILYFDGKKFVEASFSKEHVEKTEEAWGYPVKFIFENNKLILQSEFSTAEINRQSGEISTFPKMESSAGIVETANDIFFNTKSRFGTNHTFVFTGRPVVLSLKGMNAVTSAITLRIGKRALVASYNRIWDIDKKNRVKCYIFDDRILTVKSDPEGNIWLGFQNKGLYLFRNGDLNSIPLISLPRLSVSGILYDNNGGIWCTTLEKGIFYCQSTKVLSYQGIDELSERISVLQAVSGIGVLALKNGTPNLLKLSETEVSHYAEIATSSSYHNIDRVSEGLWISTSTDGIVLNETTRKSHFYLLDDLISQSYGVVEQDNRKILFRYSSLIESRGGKKWNEFYKYRKGRLKSFIQLDNSRYLLFGKNLLLLYNKLNDRVTVLKRPSEEITCAAAIYDNNVLLGTRDKGLFVYDITAQSFYPVKAGITTTIILSVLKDSYGYSWVGTNEGVFRCNAELTHSTRISEKYGLPATETRQIAEDGKYIYFGTNDGVFSLYTPAITTSSGILKPVVSIRTKGSSATISVDVNFFEKDASFYYRIEGPEQTAFTKTTIHTEQLNNLSPGDYTFYGFVQAADGSRSPVVRRSFYIAPTLVQTLWFRGLILVLCLLLIWLVIRWRIRIVRRREEEKTRINTQLAEFQMSALQAQMNPHFIFNAINTIQSYILTKNKDEAYRYLNKFSNLIRLVLHHSQDQIISLHEELQVVTTYIELEQARFSKFDYTINVHSEIDIHEVMIPAMVIQPYLENAIWHGLNNLSDRSGLLSLDFSIDNDELRIVLKDNGIGRVAAAGYKRSSHRSVGLSITKKRLEMLENMYEGSAIVEVTDEYINGQPSGTSVTIRLPLL